jgi:hypothetical protein
MVNYWLIIHDLDSYQQEPTKIGRSKKSIVSDKIFRTIKRDDRIIYYIKGKKAIGIFKVASEGHDSENGCWGKKAGYYFVFDIQPIYVNPIGMPTTIETPKHGIMTLHGRSAVSLSKTQFGNIKSEILGMSDPKNESGVVTLFSKIHQFLGFPFVKTMQSQFPDCTVIDDAGKQTRIEFENLSDDFVNHKHPVKKCDLIVCWKDTLGNISPVKVLELSDVIYGH